MSGCVELFDKSAFREHCSGSSSSHHHIIIIILSSSYDHHYMIIILSSSSSIIIVHNLTWLDRVTPEPGYHAFVVFALLWFHKMTWLTSQASMASQANIASQAPAGTARTTLCFYLLSFTSQASITSQANITSQASITSLAQYSARRFRLAEPKSVFCLFTIWIQWKRSKARQVDATLT